MPAYTRNYIFVSSGPHRYWYGYYDTEGPSYWSGWQDTIDETFSTSFRYLQDEAGFDDYLNFLHTERPEWTYVTSTAPFSPTTHPEYFI